MNYHSDTDQYKEDKENFGIAKAVAMHAIRLKAVKHSDGCYIVSRQCCICGNVFGEELDMALAKVAMDARSLCLRCDDRSEQTSGVVSFLPSIFTGWHSD